LSAVSERPPGVRWCDWCSSKPATRATPAKRSRLAESTTRSTSAAGGYGVGDNPSVSANLDLVRSIYAAWERGDFSSAEWADPEIEYVSVDGPEPGRWTGLKEMARRYGDWLRGWKDFRAEPEEYFVVDDKRILVFVQNSGRGRASGLEIEQRSVANLFEIRDGKVMRFVLYWDRDRAFADLGLTPKAG
jgi:ketosteroid isomerase-like protein